MNWATGLVTTLTATGTVIAAASTAAITTLATQASISLINNGGDISKTLHDLGSSESVRGLLTSMVTAGVTAGITNALNLPSNVAGADFATKFENYAVKGLISAGVSTAINGGKFSDSATSALVTALGQSLSTPRKQ